MPQMRPFCRDGWQGVVADTFIPPEDLDRWIGMLVEQAAIRYPSRAIAPCVCDDGIRCYAKILFGLGDHPHAIKPALKWRLRPSRALRGAAVSAAMAAAAIPCATVVLAARKRPWRPLGWPTDLVVTCEVAGKSLRQEFKRLHEQSGSPEEVRRLLAMAARAIAGLHLASFVHGDCQPGNLFLDEGREGAPIAFIDNDRTIRSHALLRRWQEKRNLVQFGFGLMARQFVTPEEWHYFLECYAHDRGVPPAPLREAVDPALERRLRQ